MIFRKGSRGHRRAGTVFSVSMFALTLSGMTLALLKDQTANFLGGGITFYLVATAWLTGRRRDGQKGVLEWIALLAALGLGAVLLTYAIQTGTDDGVPAAAFGIFGSVLLLSVLRDIRFLFRSGVSGPQRIARHLWRMCVALLIATFSFFPGQVKLFSASVRAIKVLYIPHFLIIALLIFWLFRVLRTRKGHAAFAASSLLAPQRVASPEGSGALPLPR